MNYLSHFAWNHDVCKRATDPAFVLGVALPDLWPRVSRKRRIHWPSVREAKPAAAEARALRAGLLNHAHVDAVFHQSRSFLTWLKQLADAQPRERHHAVRDFLAHVALELVLDHHLLRADPTLADRFYAELAACDAAAAQRSFGKVARIDSSGLVERLRDFRARAYLQAYVDPLALRTALRFVLGLVRVEVEPVSDAALDQVINGALDVADPAAVWHDLKGTSAVA